MLGFFFRKFVDQFIMHLEDQLRFLAPTVFLNERVRPHHRELDNVGLRPLQGRVHRHALRLRAQIRQR